MLDNIPDITVKELYVSYDTFLESMVGEIATLYSYGDKNSFLKIEYFARNYVRGYNVLGYNPRIDNLIWENFKKEFINFCNRELNKPCLRNDVKERLKNAQNVLEDFEKYLANKWKK